MAHLCAVRNRQVCREKLSNFTLIGQNICYLVSANNFPLLFINIQSEMAKSINKLRGLIVIIHAVFGWWCATGFFNIKNVPWLKKVENHCCRRSVL